MYLSCATTPCLFNGSNLFLSLWEIEIFFLTLIFCSITKLHISVLNWHFKDEDSIFLYLWKIPNSFLFEKWEEPQFYSFNWMPLWCILDFLMLPFISLNLKKNVLLNFLFYSEKNVLRFLFKFIVFSITFISLLLNFLISIYHFITLFLFHKKITFYLWILFKVF